MTGESHASRSGADARLALSATALVKTYGSRNVIDGLDLAMAPGEVLTILGPSGCGKTTLLRLVAGLELPDAGEIRIGDRSVTRPGWALEPHLRGVGLVFQAPALWPHMTVAQNIMFGLHGLPRGEDLARTRALLAQVELDGFERRYPDELSAGQARRVALVRSLAPEPPLLLLDEALTNVEADLRARLLDLVLATVSRTGAALVHVTHDAAEASHVAGRRLVMTDGRLVEDGTPLSDRCSRGAAE